MTVALEQVLLDLLPAAVLDASGTVLEVSPGFGARVGCEPSWLVGQPLLPVLAPLLAEAGGDAATLDEDRDLNLASRGERIVFRHYRCADGTRILAVVRAAPSAPAALDDVVARISRARHQVNNLLMSMMGHADLILAVPGLPDAARAKADRILQDAGRIRDEVAGLSSHARTLQRQAAAQAAEDPP